MIHTTGTISLQATLSAASADPTVNYYPHHPITCKDDLRYEEDGSFACEHITVPADDPRTINCVNHSVALLIIEEAMRQHLWGSK